MGVSDPTLYIKWGQMAVPSQMRDFCNVKKPTLKAPVNIVFDRFKKVKTVLADLCNYVQMGEKTAKIQKIMKTMHSL